MKRKRQFGLSGRWKARVLFASLVALTGGVGAFGLPLSSSATLYISTDNDVFSDSSGGHIAVVQTSGASVVNTNVLTTTFPVNGLALGARATRSCMEEILLPTRCGRSA